MSRTDLQIHIIHRDYHTIIGIAFIKVIYVVGWLLGFGFLSLKCEFILLKSMYYAHQYDVFEVSV